MTMWNMLLIFALAGIMMLFYFYFISYKSFALPGTKNWFWLFILSSICTVFAMSYSIKLKKRLSAFFVNLTVNLEPIYGIILALLIFGEQEQMSVGFYIGTGLILLFVLIYPLLNKKYKRKPLETDIFR